MMSLLIVRTSAGTGEPEGMAIHCLHGFVEELVVNDDPEYQVYTHRGR